MILVACSRQMPGQSCPADSSIPGSTKAFANTTRRPRRRGLRFIAQLDAPGPGEFAAHRPELRQLLGWSQQRGPALFGRTVELEQFRIPERVHDRQLGVAARRRGGDQKRVSDNVRNRCSGRSCSFPTMPRWHGLVGCTENGLNLRISARRWTVRSPTGRPGRCGDAGGDLVRRKDRPRVGARSTGAGGLGYGRADVAGRG